MFLDRKFRLVIAASWVLVTSEQLLAPEIRLRIASITAAVRSQIVTLTCATCFIAETSVTGLSGRNLS